MKLPTFIECKRNCKKDKSGLKSVKLTIMGDCATQHLATALTGYGYTEGFDFQILDTDYNQIGAQVMDPESEFYKHEGRFVLIYMCSEKLYHAYCEAEDKSGFADMTFAKIQNTWKMINQNCNITILQYAFVESDDRIWGNYALKEVQSFLFQVKKLNYLMMNGAQEVKNVFLVDLNYIAMQNGRAQMFDEKLYYIAKMPLSTMILPEVARQTTGVIKSVLGNIRKCLVTDLDNTLWGGVIGDDGLEGIQIGELGLGHAFEELQMWMKELKNRGLLLAVCSKNNEDTAREPFEKHPDMILKLEDFSMFVANWEDKASNIRYIQETLNIGMDSLVFIDDNPFEREQVRSQIPDITVPELPEDPAAYLAFLKELNLFETASFSQSDKDRTRQYQEERKRDELKAAFQNYDEYLQSLDMQATVSSFDKFQFPRIAQLTQRSNQFNLRTVRYTEGEIAQLADDENYLTLYFMLKDKFGNHGLISLAILEKQPDDTLFMHNWLMSCRVLKRGMEEFIINTVIDTAREHGFKRVIGEYIQTPKNAMVKDIYEKLGFKRIDETHFIAEIDGFVRNKTYIIKENEVNKNE